MQSEKKGQITLIMIKSILQLEVEKRGLLSENQHRTIKKEEVVLNVASKKVSSKYVSLK